MTNASEELWFGVRCVFNLGVSKENPGVTHYEERIIILKASSFSEAIDKAEVDAQQYKKDTDAEYTGLAQVFHICDAEITDMSEVFSLIRDSRLDEQAYLDHYFDSGTERQRYTI